MTLVKEWDILDMILALIFGVGMGMVIAVILGGVFP